MITYYIFCFVFGVLSALFTKEFWQAIVLNLIATLILPLAAKAETYYSFKYKTKDELKISVPATDYFEARTKASKLCFQALTGGKYQGEEAGMNIISICVNPLK